MKHFASYDMSAETPQLEADNKSTFFVPILGLEASTARPLLALAFRLNSGGRLCTL